MQEIESIIGVDCFWNVNEEQLKNCLYIDISEVELADVPRQVYLQSL